MRSCFRIMVAVAIAVMSVVGIHGVAVAATGSITGYVREDDGITPIDGGYVVVYTLSYNYVASTNAQISGFYSITGLPSGTYKVWATGTKYLPEYYDGKSAFDEANSVSVTDGQATPNINFTLSRGCSISGHVFNEDNPTQWINAARVEVINAATHAFVAEGRASADGSYSVTFKDPGTYHVRAEYHGWWMEYYDNVTDPTAAAKVTVAAMSDNAGIDFSLKQAGCISGHVYEADGVTAITSATIYAYDEEGGMVGYGHSGASNGLYYINLDPGTYRIRAHVTGYTDQWYNNAATYASATDITVVSVGDDNTNNNFSMGAVQAVTTTTAAATGMTTTSATLNGNLTSMGAETSVDVSFQYGLTTSYGSTTTPVAKTAVGAFSAPATGLESGKTYHFRAKADGVYGADMTFTTTALAPPVVTTTAASNATTTSVTLNGNLSSLGTAGSVVVSFQYGTATGSYAQATDNHTLSTATTFSASLTTGLVAGTKYYFRAKADGDGDPVYGAEMTFTTLTTPPTVATDNASTVANTTATLNGSLTSKGTAASSVIVCFQYGTTSGSYSYTTDNQTLSATGSFSANLTGLTTSTKYYFRAKADGDGDPVYGAENSFTPVDTVGPVISLGEPSDLTTSGATIKWTTDEAATTQVEYGLTKDYDLSPDPDASLVTNHSVELADLKAGKTYHYRVISKDAANNQTVSADETFTTTGGSGGMPVWGWVLIGLAAVGVLGGAAFLIKGRMAKP